VKKDDAFLAIDLDHNGIIDNAGELFGEYTNAEILGPKTFKNGFEALAQFDSNRDGVVDARDQRFSELMVWFDRNQNGQTDRGELVSLASQNIKALSLAFKDQKNQAGQYALNAGNEVRLVGSFTKTDGKEFQMSDVWFKLRRNADQATTMVRWMMSSPKK
jgi:hypothetical protein